MSDDPFGRAGEERTDAFGRPLRGEEADGGDAERDAGSRWLPPVDEPAAGAPGGFAPPGADQPGGFAPPGADRPGGFAPPTDNPPDASAWWAGVRPGTIEGRAHPYGQPAAYGVAAEWPQRAGAAAIDFLVRLGIYAVFFLLGAIAYAGGSDAGEVGTTIGLVVGVVAALAYAPWMIATRNGQTIGHRVSGTRIVRSDGSPLSGGGAFVREVLAKGILFDGILIWLTIGILPLLNYLWPLWDDRNEALHDKMCSTRVVTA